VELNETEFSNAKTVADVERLLLEPTARRTEHSTLAGPSALLSVPAPRGLLRAGLARNAILGHPRILGRENLRSLRGPVLIVSNHITRARISPDSCSPAAAVAAIVWHCHGRRNIAGDAPAATRFGFSPNVGPTNLATGSSLLSSTFFRYAIFRLSREFRFAGESVDRGYSVLVFPEAR